MTKKPVSLIIALTILMILIWFGWFQWRPSQIATYCNWFVQWAEDGPKCKTRSCYKDYYSKYYEICLHEKGIK